MCSACLKQLARRSQHRLVEVRDAWLKTHVPEIGKRERFVTLTCPTLQGLSLLDATKVFNSAFAMLADHPFWTTRVDAGAKHLEFTVRPRGYHTHIHLLVYSRFIERDEGDEVVTREWRSQRSQRLAEHGMRVVKDDLPPVGNLQDVWTSCLTQTAARFGREIQWGAPPENDGWYTRLPDTSGEVIEVQPTSGRKANVHICVVREKGRPGNGEIGIDSVTKELTKYLTKASSWSDVSDDQLVEIAEVKRWPRCFELLGAWRRLNQEKAEECDLMLTRPLLRIRPNETWEDFCKRCHCDDADPASYVRSWDALLVADALYVAGGGVNASLDTDFLSQEPPETEESPPFQNLCDRPRSPSLMELGERMNFDEWLRIVQIRLASTRRVRTVLLAKRYPSARFYCLDGTEFGRGESKSLDLGRPAESIAA
jgi:hypothetical protein